MSDPRNAAHDKKVRHDKKHSAEVEANKADTEAESDPEAAAETAPPAAVPSPEAAAHHEACLAVLTQVKDMEFHSRASLERLGKLMLTVQDELKQKDFASSLGELFTAQDAVQTQLTAFILEYQAECERV